MKFSDYSYQIMAKVSKPKPFAGFTNYSLTVYDIWDLNKYHMISIYNNNIFICHVNVNQQGCSTSIRLRRLDALYWSEFVFNEILTNPKINLLEILKREKLYANLAQDLERACS